MHIRLSCNPHSMKGFLLCLIVIVAVVAVRSQGPPTRTKKGKRPPRRNDNPDVGLPSGADIPDGRYQVVKSPVNVPPRGGGAPPPPSYNGPPKGGPIKGGPPKGGPPKGGPIKGGPPKGGPPKGGPIKGGPPTPPKVVPPKSGPRPGKYGPPSGGPPARPPVRPPMSGPPKVLPPGKYGPPKLPPAGKYGPPKSGVKIAGGRRNDNPDRGLPSGRDFPDNRRTKTRSGPPPKRRPYGGVKPINYVPPVPKWYAPAVPAVPAAPAAPAHSCDYYCQFEGYKPVCTIYGNEYDNDCYRACRNEPRDCENQCPCDSNANPVDQTGPIVPAVPWGGRCDHCYNNEHSPVCVDGEETMYNECFANCEGKAPTCTSACPCT